MFAFADVPHFPNNVPIEGVHFDADDLSQARAEANLHPDVNITEGGQLYLCFQGDLNKLQQTVVNTLEGHLTVETLSLDPLIGDNGQRSIALNNTSHRFKGSIANTSKGIEFFNTKVRTAGTSENGRSIKNIISQEGEEKPYMDYILGGSHLTPCDKGRIEFEKIFIDKDASWLVVQLPAAAEAAANAPAPAPEAPAAPVLQNSPALPQSAGCSMAIASSSNFNFGFALLFSLLLSPIAFRLRRK